MAVIEAKSGPTIRDDVYFFNDKDIYKGEIGSFIFTKNEITHNLDIYQILNGQFSKVK